MKKSGGIVSGKGKKTSRTSVHKKTDTSYLKEFRILSDIALLSGFNHDSEKMIQSVIREAGLRTGLSRILVFSGTGNGRFSVCYEWCTEKIPSLPVDFVDLDQSNLPNLHKMVSDSERVLASEVTDLPGDLAAFFLSRGVRSAALYPVSINCGTGGIVIFEDCSANRKWSAVMDELLFVIAAMIAKSFKCHDHISSLNSEIGRIDLKKKTQMEFITRMSHEIRTPLNVILGMSEALYYKVDSESNRRLVKSVLSGGKMLLSLLNDTLEISRIEADKFVVDRKITDTGDLLDQLEIFFRDIAAKKNLNFFVEKGTMLPDRLMLDERRVRQILYNLILNAITYTRWGHIIVSADYIKKGTGSGRLICRVADTGPGMTEDKLSHVFDEYTQFEHAMFYDEGCTGLGLSLSKMLAEAMDGDLKAESIAGKGSVFILSLPAEMEGRKEAEALQARDLNEIVFRDASLLIVDDNQDGIEVIESHIGDSGINVFSAGSFESALEKLRNNRIDLIVMDLYMPFISGSDMVKMLRTKPELKNIPIVSYTSVSSDERKLWDPDTFDDHLGKPVTRDNLFRILTRFLRYEMKGGEKKKDKR